MIPNKCMNPDENIGVLEAARAIAAGRRVDRAAIESSADLSESLAGLLRELKIVEDIAELHRSLPAPITSLSDPAGGLLSLQTVETVAPAPTWGSLRLLERVGEGAFGDVFRAWDPRLDREVALKLLRRPDSQHDSVGSLVIDEGHLLARVRHPNVVTVLRRGPHRRRVGLWMEFVRGRTIAAGAEGTRPIQRAGSGAHRARLCRAFSAVHRAGLIHRDIKAHNVMREDGGRIVLMDLSTGREDLDDPHAELAGTPLYLAPEVFEGRPPQHGAISTASACCCITSRAGLSRERTHCRRSSREARGTETRLAQRRTSGPARGVRAGRRALAPRMIHRSDTKALARWKRPSCA